MDIILDEQLDFSHQPELGDGIDLYVQRVRSAIALFEGEWRLDGNAGLPWLRWFQTVPTPFGEIASVVRATISDVEGIEEVSELDVSQDGGVIVIEGEVTSSAGPFELTTQAEAEPESDVFHPIFTTNARLL